MEAGEADASSVKFGCEWEEETVRSLEGDPRRVCLLVWFLLREA